MTPTNQTPSRETVMLAAFIPAQTSPASPVATLQRRKQPVTLTERHNGGCFILIKITLITHTD